ncbi:MAG: SufD family Fe-S cluster assembly protein [Candidatus Peribacteria bacterium]|nr:SufD family Fe-S cluster assembly protein [Candidatus Peribacteria bacterium]
MEAKPKLLIESNDVKASHSCKVERINKEKMFYLKSRGISENEVVKLLLEANIKSLFL